MNCGADLDTEFTQGVFCIAIGFIVMGFVDFFVKLIFTSISINKSSLDLNRFYILLGIHMYFLQKFHCHSRSCCEPTIL